MSSTTHLELPWLGLHFPQVDNDLWPQVERATAKFARGTTDPSVDLSVTLTCAPTTSPEAARELRARADAQFQFVWGVTGDAQSEFVTSDGSTGTVCHRSGRLHFELHPHVFSAPYSTWSDLFAAPLAEHLREHGCYPAHAAAVTVDEGTLLVIGASGTGKTTVSLALLAGGGTWRADDKVLVRRRDGGELEAVSLYRNTNLAPTTLAHHPDLASLGERPPIDETNEKRACLLLETRRAIDLTPFRPSALFFPRQTSAARSSFVRIDATDALLLLSGQSPMSGHRPRVRRQHELLAETARRLPAWIVETGRDVLEAPAAFAERARAEIGTA